MRMGWFLPQGQKRRDLRHLTQRPRRGLVEALRPEGGLKLSPKDRGLGAQAPLEGAVSPDSPF